MNGIQQKQQQQQLQRQPTSACSRKPSTSSILSMANVTADPPMLNPQEEFEDRLHLQKIVTAFRFYRKYAYARLNKTESYLSSLPKNQQIMLSTYRKHLSNVRDCIDENQAVINKMLRENIMCESSDQIEAMSNTAIYSHQTDGHPIKINTQDVEKTQSTLKLIARDWSASGAKEREQSYQPIIDAIEEFFKPSDYKVNEIKILVPGAGLGRLIYELGCRGYECEGNEFSYFMLIASHFVLNQCTEVDEFTLYPWVHQYDNNLRQADQVASIRFPDVCPAQHPPKGKISMAAGDFLEVYKEPNCYDCVATCFFIDCANNVVDFIQAIYNILVPGGIWVNLGPLLYHYSDIQGENSIEPPYEDLERVFKAIGFEILRSKTGLRTKYAQNPRSIAKNEYESLFWICRKPVDAMNKRAEMNGESNDYENDDDVVDGGDRGLNHDKQYTNGYNI